MHTHALAQYAYARAYGYKNFLTTNLSSMIKGHSYWDRKSNQALLGERTCNYIQHSSLCTKILTDIRMQLHRKEGRGVEARVVR